MLRVHATSRLFDDLPREHGFEPLQVEGAIPPDLRGTLYRNGPGLFSSHGTRYGHLFDGDGAVSAVRFGDDVRGAVRIVETPTLVEERRRGRMIYGGYGTRVPNPIRAILGRGYKNPANTSVMYWGDRLFALCEGGLPTELKAEDLATIGETDLGVVPITFSAHPHRVAARRTSYNFGVRYQRHPMLDVFALPDGGPARLIATLPLPRITMIHDFIATESHLLFFVPPLDVNPFPVLFGGGLSPHLRWRPDHGTEVIVIPIDEPERVQRFTTESFYQWHFANAFERGDEIVVDFVRYPDFTSEQWLRDIYRGTAQGVTDGQLHRAVVDPGARSVRIEPLSETVCEFPRLHPELEGADYRFTYVADYPDQRSMSWLPISISKIDVRDGTLRRFAFDAGHGVSEPVFVPRPGSTEEDDGYVLSFVYHEPSHRTCCAVLDARRIEDGPVAKVWFDHHLPPTFHGCFVPS